MSAEREWWQDFFKGPWGALQAEGYPDDRTRAEVDFMVSALALEPGDRVLDLACGIGRHSIALRRRGLNVTGIDFNGDALAIARRAAEATAATEPASDLQFIESDMRAIDFSAAFDAVVCYFTSFGYFEREEDDFEVARRVARALRPGGRFLLELMSLETLAPIWQPQRWQWINEQKTRRLLEEARIDFATSRVEADWTFIDPDRTQTVHSSLRLYSCRELHDLLRRAGFGQIESLNPVTGGAFTLGSRRLAIVATR